ncbi:MAG: DnaJ domain-containing protein [Bryobacteraceae bacterium]|nr:DnaJ domain-containing protein [Bryobacteraceae bacterium]
MITSSTTERRTRNRNSKAQGHELRLRLSGPGSSGRVITVTLLDQAPDGLGLLSREELAEGSLVELHPTAELLASGGQLPGNATVAWCQPTRAGRFRIGLRLPVAAPPPPPPSQPVEEADADYYEILQIHPNAHPDTIHRVYRILAQRYHPDNQETGSQELFRSLVRAYDVVSDPERRAAYDLQHQELHRKRFRVAAANGNGGAAPERAKRQALLAALYHRRLQEPASPSLSIFDLEECLGVPREHLEFTLWYVKERALITRSDNNRFQITVAGVDECERLEEAAGPQRLLPAAH